MGEVWERVLALLVDDSRSTASAWIDNRVWPNSHGDDGSRTQIHAGQIMTAYSVNTTCNRVVGDSNGAR